MSIESFIPEMKQIMEQYFLLLSGKRAMTGDFVGYYKITNKVQAGLPIAMYAFRKSYSPIDIPLAGYNENTDHITFGSSALSADLNFNETNIPNVGDVQLITNKRLAVKEGSELTIASGIITVVGSRHRVDTENNEATDDLDRIDGGTDGMLLMLRPANSDRTVVVKHGTWNIALNGRVDFTMDSQYDLIFLMFSWQFSVWQELSRLSFA